LETSLDGRFKRRDKMTEVVTKVRTERFGLLLSENVEILDKEIGKKC